MIIIEKKFLNPTGLSHFYDKIDAKYVDGDVFTSAIDVINDELINKVNDEDIASLSNQEIDEIVETSQISNYDSTKTYSVGDFCFYNEILYCCIADISSPEAWNSNHWEEATESSALVELIDLVQDANAEISDLKDDLSELDSKVDGLSDSSVKSLESDANLVDLDVTDENGNVIVRFTKGHVKTKNFDSENIETGGDVLSKPSSSDADLVVVDDVGNVLLQMKSGHIKTKYFDSTNIAGMTNVTHRISGDDYYKEFTYNNSNSSTVTISGDFREGDIILCHFSNMENTDTDSTSSAKATYYYVDSNGFNQELGQDYPYNFPRYTLPSDTSSIVAVFPSSLLTTGEHTCRFIVYKLGEYERKPNIVTVATDGSKMFTSIRDAMDSITDNNAYNQYEIWVYPGTYNIMSDYTADEIEASGFKGLFVKNGVSIIGIGHREKIIIHGELNTSDYDSTIRNNISTLNMAGNCGLKNLKITNKNLRYAVHDDRSSASYQEQTRIVENCIITSRNAASGGPGEVGYGAGGCNNKKMILRDCDLGERLIIHNTDGMTVPMTALVQNCRFKIVTLTDCNSPNAPTRIQFDNCEIGVIRHMLSSGHNDQSMVLCGIGTHDALIDIAGGVLYEWDCERFPGTVVAGKAVAVNNQMQIETTTNRLVMYGVSIGNDGTDTLIQTRGYINSATLGLSGLSVGDYVTLDASGNVTATNATASNAVGVVTAVSQYSSSAFIKLIF